MRIFISYARKDSADFAQKLSLWLKDQNYEPWLDIEDGVPPGSQYDIQIELGISQSTLLIALISPCSIRPDGFCRKELLFAQHHQVPILPIRLGNVIPPIQIISLNYIDAIEHPALLFTQIENAIDSILTYHQLPAPVGVEQQRTKSWWESLKKIDFEEEISKFGGAFIGREWLFQQIEEWAAGEHARLLLITADAGVGKSMFAAQTTARMNVHGVHFCSRSNIESCRPISWINSLIYQLAMQFPAYRKILESMQNPNFDGPPESLFRSLISDPLRTCQDQLQVKDPWIFVIDGLDEAFAISGHEFIDLMSGAVERLPFWLRILITSRPDERIISRFKLDGVSQNHIDASGEENTHDVEEFVRYRFSLSDSDISYANEISKVATGNFLFAKMTLDALISNENDYKMNFSDIGKLPDKLGGLYYAMFRKRFQDVATYERDIMPLLECLCAALAPLPEHILKEASGLDERSFRMAFQVLSQFLDKSKKGVKLFHLSIIEWLSSDELSGEYFVSIQQGHIRLATVCHKEFQRDPHSASEYTIHFLPSHLRSAGFDEELFSNLTDFFYLKMKIEKAGIYELISDFSLIGPEIGLSREKITILKEYLQFLRSRSHILFMSPGSFFQEAYNAVLFENIHASALTFSSSSSNENRPWLKWLNSHQYRSRLIQTLIGHFGQINALAVSPDENRIISGSQDRTIRIWDSLTGKCLKTLKGHSDIISALSIVDNSTLVSGSRDSKLILWDYQSGQIKRVLSDKVGHVYGLAPIPEHNFVVSASDDKTLRVWNLTDFEYVSTFSGHSSSVTSVIKIPNTDTVISGDFEGRIIQWQIQSGTILREIMTLSKSVKALAVTSDGRYLVACGDGANIRVWDLQKNESLNTFESTSGLITSAIVTPDNTTVITGGTKKRLNIADFFKGCTRCEIPVYDRNTRALAMKPFNSELISGNWDGSIKIWDLSQLDDNVTRPQGISEALSIFLMSDTKHFITISAYGNIAIWDSENGNLDHIINEKTHSKGKIGIYHTKNSFIFANHAGQMKVANLDSELYETTLGTHEGKVIDIQVSPDDLFAVSVGYDNKIKIWNLTNFSLNEELLHERDSFHGLRFSPDGQYLVLISSKYLDIWDFSKRRVKTTIIDKNAGFREILITPDSSAIISRNSDKTLTVWDIHSGEKLHIFGGFPDRATSMAFLEDGESIAVVSYGGYIKIWDLKSGELKRHHIEENNDYITFLSALSNQSLLLTASFYDGIVKVWKLTGNDNFETIAQFGCENGVQAGAVTGNKVILSDKGGLLYILEFIENGI